ncbi:dTDP-4-dehydrorhamnose 3,5-epimerase family protein, partial [Candidatus Woesebacteria bacterium]|nr:dTDP-4-dehydrorhamnose 3,5-epimerase family protein [Candidatus Woesebacteria bacterium]
MTEILTKDIKLPESIRETSIPGLLIVERKINRDERGFFREVFRLS